MTQGRDDDRPDPDALLARIGKRRPRRQRGRLKIFFGAAPGVGKTYAMLAEARGSGREGRDVVVGIVETHGRRETEACSKGSISCRASGSSTAARAQGVRSRRGAGAPAALLLVDELAHTNAPGLAAPQALAGRPRAPRRRHRRLHTVNVQHWRA